MEASARVLTAAVTAIVYNLPIAAAAIGRF